MHYLLRRVDLNRDVQWYQRKFMVVIAICVCILMCAVWFWRVWVGIGITTEVQTTAADSFEWALKQSVSEATTPLIHITTDKGDSFYIPDYWDGYNAQNLKSLFVYRMNQSPSVPMFRVESIQINPTATMQYIVQIRYATWLGLSKTVTVSGNPPIPHKKQ
jgi:hypothetical protein